MAGTFVCMLWLLSVSGWWYQSPFKWFLDLLPSCSAWDSEGWIFFQHLPWGHKHHNQKDKVLNQWECVQGEDVTWRSRARSNQQVLYRWCPAQRGTWMQAEPPYLEHGACPHSGVSTWSQMTPSHRKPREQLSCAPSGWDSTTSGKQVWWAHKFCAENPSIHLHSNMHTHPHIYAVHSAMQYDAWSSLSTTGFKIT